MDFSISSIDKVRRYDSDDFKIDEANFETNEEDQGWIRINPELKSENNWKLGAFTAGIINDTYQAILNQRAEEKKRKEMIMYASIGGGVLLLILLIFIILKRKKKNKLIVAL